MEETETVRFARFGLMLQSPEETLAGRGSHDRLG